jgi:hypothetical protein
MNSAVISECGTYRYRLDRDVQPEGLVFAYFGINPSTADANLDDATVRKWRGYTIRNGGRKFIVGNVFAFRSTDPKGLTSTDDPFGPDRFTHLEQIIAEADVLVPCWGNLSKMPVELRDSPGALLKRLLSSGKGVMHFGVTESGQPKHPLMLGYETSPMIPWGFA